MLEWTYSGQRAEGQSSIQRAVLSQKGCRLWGGFNTFSLSLHTNRGSNKRAPKSFLVFWWFLLVSIVSICPNQSWAALQVLWILLEPWLQGRQRAEHQLRARRHLGTEVAAALYCLRNLVSQEISPRLRSAVFKPLHATRATEEALGQRKFDPLCLEVFLYSTWVATLEVLAKVY